MTWGEFWARIQPLSAPALTTLGAFVVLAMGLFPARDSRRRGTHLMLAAFLFLGGAMAIGISKLASPHAPLHHFDHAIVADGLAYFVEIIVLFAAAFTIILSPRFLETHRVHAGEYYGLLLLATAGMQFMVRSEDLITLFLSLELMSISSYVLCGQIRTDGRSAEASLKYFVNGAFASAFLLYGAALMYGATGSLVLTDIGLKITDTPLATTGLVLALVGFLFKIGAAPFHLWLPDAYEGAPTPVTAFMSVAVKAAAFGALIRVGLEASDQSKVMVEVAAIATAVTLILGNVVAAAQSSVKRMLAYSSIAHTGYALIGVVTAMRSTGAAREEALEASLLYLFLYGFMSIGAFAMVQYAGRNGRDAESYDDFAGLSTRRPWAALAMTIFMLSLAGIPPTAGFFAKFTIFKAALSTGETALVIVGVLTTVVSLYYYLKVVVAMYMRPAPEGAVEGEPDGNAGLAVALAAIFTVALGIVPMPYLDLINRSVASLFN